MNISPCETSTYLGPKTSTPITYSGVKLEEKGLDSSEDELDVDSLDDSIVEQLLPLLRQVRDEYISIDERTTAVLEKTGLAFDQLSDDAKVAVECLVEQKKTSVGGSAAASAVIHAVKQLETFSKDRYCRKMKEDADKLSQMLAEQTYNLEVTKQKFNDVLKIVENEKLSLEKMQLESKPPTLIQKKKKRVEQLEAKIERLHMEEVTPQACVVELEKRTKLETEVKVLRTQLKEFCDLPPNISDAEKVVHDAKQNLATLKSQLKALYK